MNILLVYPMFADTFWGLKHPLENWMFIVA